LRLNIENGTWAFNNAEDETVATEIAQLKADLTDLNMKCQLARDNEVRFALQRGRLEAERTGLLVKMIEALSPAAAPVAASSDPYRVVMSCPMGKTPPIVQPREAVPAMSRTPSRTAGKRKRSLKPANSATTADMVLTVLQGAGWLRPNQITAVIKQRFWPAVTGHDIAPVVWRLGKLGRLEKGDDGYRLPALKSNGRFEVQ
jgi:hypothetical protein